MGGPAFFRRQAEARSMRLAKFTASTPSPGSFDGHEVAMFHCKVPYLPPRRRCMRRLYYVTVTARCSD